jgi:hypothetical protein
VAAEAVDVDDECNADFVTTADDTKRESRLVGIIVEHIYIYIYIVATITMQIVFTVSDR